MKFSSLFFLIAAIAPLDEVAIVAALAEKYQAVAEVRLWDSTRVDLLSDKYAIEADFAPKWAEAIGQSLYYATVTNREPAIILLVRDIRAEQKYIYRCQTICAKYKITLFIEVVK